MLIAETEDGLSLFFALVAGADRAKTNAIRQRGLSRAADRRAEDARLDAISKAPDGGGEEIAKACPWRALVCDGDEWRVGVGFAPDVCAELPQLARILGRTVGVAFNHWTLTATPLTSADDVWRDRRVTS